MYKASSVSTFVEACLESMPLDLSILTSGLGASPRLARQPREEANRDEHDSESATHGIVPQHTLLDAIIGVPDWFIARDRAMYHAIVQNLKRYLNLYRN